MIPHRLTCALLPLVFGVFAGTGCVWRSQYDALQAQHIQLQQRFAETTAQGTAERESLSQQVGIAHQSATQLAGERERLQHALVLERQHAADVRGRVQQMWTIMQSIMTTLSPAPLSEPPPSTAGLPPPPRM